jgi:hypothetical protein
VISRKSFASLAFRKIPFSGGSFGYQHALGLVAAGTIQQYTLKELVTIRKPEPRESRERI